MADLREGLRAALKAAIKSRDLLAVSALRTTIAAVDNAEAVPAAPLEGRRSDVFGGAVAGLGAGEVPRRALGADEVLAIVQAEIDERIAAADAYDVEGQAEAADRLRAEAEVLRRHLAEGRWS